MLGGSLLSLPDVGAIIGGDDHLLPYLEEALSKACDVRIIVSFLMESGAKIILPALQEAAGRGTSIKIITSTYLSVTEPPALYLLMDGLGERSDVRLFDEPGRSFHPKAYLFDYGDYKEAFIGSSNLSRSGLTTGIEWNYRIRSSEAETSKSSISKFKEEFDGIFFHRSRVMTEDLLKQYAISWKQPHPRFDSIVGMPMSPTSKGKIEPRGMQIEALYHLKRSREDEVRKGLVVAPTGIGKTYIAAFDSRDFKKVLYIAHREEILKQAKESFERIRPGNSTGIIMGDLNQVDSDICFASVQTLSKDDRLQSIPKDKFDYIIVDEFHHAAADSYLRVLGHFDPQFTLGLTATPYRMDNRDIFTLCDDNVIYESYLKEAINRGYLSPFRYFGIYDEVANYDNIQIKNGQYDVDQLEKELSTKSRADLVLQKYRTMAGASTLGFCVSIAHAEYMADYFTDNGIKAVCCHSGAERGRCFAERPQAIKGLKDRTIHIVFAVDIFNEGLDVPSLDTVMFLRPTESFVIFLQQLGRGLRKEKEKSFLTVLDFIGNYRKAHYIPSLLAGENPSDERIKGIKPTNLEFPELCQVNFDFRVLDLFETLAKSDPLPKRMKEEYFRIKSILKRKPTRTDIYEGSDIPFREYVKDGWLRFLKSCDELDVFEEKWLNSPAEEFLRSVEKTSFTKAYKVPTILSFVDESGNMRSDVTLDAIGAKMKAFYESNSTYGRDMTDIKNKDWRKWDIRKFARHAEENPVHFLSLPEDSFFHYDKINKIFALDELLKPYISNQLAAHVLDIMKQRTINHFATRYRENA